MIPKKITLKDIAARCGVTPTLVSAVLNGRRGPIGYTEKRRVEILRAAEEMGYHPNILARSMVSRRLPVIGVLLCADSVGADGDFDYFNTVFPRLTEKLNARGLEALFAPFRDEDEQLRRIEHLRECGLVGGIVTNLKAHQHDRVAGKLSAYGMPYMILGNPPDAECHCVYSPLDFSWCETYCRRHCIASRTLVVKSPRGPVCCPLPLTGECDRLSGPLSESECRWDAEDRLFIFSRAELLWELPRLPRHSILLAPDERRGRGPVAPIPTVYNSDMYGERLEYVADTVARWLASGREPLPRRMVMRGNTVTGFANFAPEEMPAASSCAASNL